MRLSYDEKLRLAEQIRSTSPLKARIEPEYREYFDQVYVEDTTLDTCEGSTHVYLLRAKRHLAGAPLIVNFHGGGFCIGHHERDLIFSAKMAVKTNGITVDVDYKLAPEYGYPVAVNEGYDVVAWCVENAVKLGCDPRKIILMGHSAGASIVAAICLKANETKDFKAALQVLDYPATDMTKPKETGLRQESGRGAAFRTLYTDDIDELIQSPYVSPVYATKHQLCGLPATLLITAGKDPLRFEAEKYGALMASAGVTVTTQRFLDSCHGFVIYGNGQRDEAHELILQMVGSVTARFKTASVRQMTECATM